MVKLTLSCLGGHLQIHGDIEPSPVVLGEQTTMEKTTKRFQRIATLADLDTKGLNAQAVDDLLTMYVCSKSARPPQELLCLNKRLTTSTDWLRPFGPTLSNATPPLRCFFYSLNLVDSAVQRHAAAPWRAWQSIIPTFMATTQSPDTDSLFNATPRLRAQLAQLQTTLSPQKNKPAFQLKPLGAALRLNTSQKRQVSTIQRNIQKQFYDSLADTPVERAILQSQSTSLVRTSCSPAVKRVRLRIAASASQ